MNSDPLVLEHWLNVQSKRVDHALAEIGDSLGQSQVEDAIRYALDGGGKRLRPALLLAAHEAVAGSAEHEAVLRLACGVEMIHTYSLVHDDLPCMDDDNLRRGRPTLHRAFDQRTAMAAGAALIPLAFRVLLAGCAQAELSAELTLKMAHELAHAAGGAGMVGGQVLDLESEGRAISLEDLEFLHRAKTGALISAAVRMGGMAAHATVDQMRALSTYARCLGLAFQIADDLLDETTSSHQLGKTAGKDRAVAKATFPAMLGQAEAAARAKAEISEATTALRDAGLDSPVLEALGWFAIERRR